MSPEQIDRGRQTAAISVLLGCLGFFVLPWVLATPYGMMSSLAAVFLGATRGMVVNFRTERGIWLAALFVIACTTPIWVGSVLMNIFRSGSTPSSLSITIDLSVCTIMWGAAVRLALSAGWHNWRLVRPRSPRIGWRGR